MSNKAERFMAAPDEAEAQEKIDRFFDDVLDELGYGQEERIHYCEIRSREIAREGYSTITPHLSDDRVTELLAHDRTIAFAIDIRDGFNFRQVMCASFLSTELLDELREAQVAGQ